MLETPLLTVCWAVIGASSNYLLPLLIGMGVFYDYSGIDHLLSPSVLILCVDLLNRVLIKGKLQ